MTFDLMSSRALWNRDRLDLTSDEILAQLMDRGEMAAWRELYRLAAADYRLAERMAKITQTVPLGFVYFWRAAIASLGVPVDFDRPAPTEVQL